MKSNTMCASWCAALLLTLVTAQSTCAAESSGSGSMPMPPAQMVLQQMHLANQTEIKAAEMARQKAQSTLVKRYADRLWRDHRTAAGKIQTLASELGFQLRSPDEMKQMMTKMQQMKDKMQTMQQMLSKLQSTPPGQFDKTYVVAMVKAHENVVHTLEKVQEQNLNYPRVGGLVDKLLPILKQHLELARHLQSRLNSRNA